MLFFFFGLYQMRAIFGFGIQTAYLSVTYLYRFLLRHRVDVSDKNKEEKVDLDIYCSISVFNTIRF